MKEHLLGASITDMANAGAWEAKEKHKSHMKQVLYQFQAHCLWKWLYNYSVFGHYRGNCDEHISPEFSFRRHRARCSLKGRVHAYYEESGEPY